MTDTITSSIGIIGDAVVRVAIFCGNITDACPVVDKLFGPNNENTTVKLSGAKDISICGKTAGDPPYNNVSVPPFALLFHVLVELLNNA